MNESQKQEAAEILLNKLREMSELELDDFDEDKAVYNGCCSVMVDITRFLAEL